MSPEPGGLQPQHPDLQLDQVHLRQRQEVHRRRLRDLALSLAGRGRLQPRSATGAPQEEGRTEGESSVLPGERSEQRHERELRRPSLLSFLSSSVFFPFLYLSPAAHHSCVRWFFFFFFLRCSPDLSFFPPLSRSLCLLFDSSISVLQPIAISSPSSI
ncbi:uncharacterized protein O3Q21_013395, partial [Podargus strigoides]